MKRNLKALGLALCAVFALGAMSASAASALESHDIEATAGTTLSVKSNNLQEFFATEGDSRAITCENVSVTGTLPAAVNPEVTVTPNYTNCEADLPPNKLSAEVTENGCHYTFTGDTTHTEGETAGDHAAVHLTGCEGGKGITVDVTFLNLECIHIPEQELHGVVYAQSGNDIELQATVHGIHSTTTGACEEEEEAKNTHTNGVYLGNVVVQGNNPLTLTTTES